MVGAMGSEIRQRATPTPARPPSGAGVGAPSPRSGTTSDDHGGTTTSVLDPEAGHTVTGRVTIIRDDTEYSVFEHELSTAGGVAEMMTILQSYVANEAADELEPDIVGLLKDALELYGSLREWTNADSAGYPVLVTFDLNASSMCFDQMPEESAEDAESPELDGAGADNGAGPAGRPWPPGFRLWDGPGAALADTPGTDFDRPESVVVSIAFRPAQESLGTDLAYAGFEFDRVPSLDEFCTAVTSKLLVIRDPCHCQHCWMAVRRAPGFRSFLDRNGCSAFYTLHDAPRAKDWPESVRSDDLVALNPEHCSCDDCLAKPAQTMCMQLAEVVQAMAGREDLAPALRHHSAVYLDVAGRLTVSQIVDLARVPDLMPFDKSPAGPSFWDNLTSLCTVM